MQSRVSITVLIIMALIQLKVFVVPIINSSITESIKLSYNECPYRRSHLCLFKI